MIADRLTHAQWYAAITPRIQRAFEFLNSTDLSALPVGRLELDGSRLYVLVQAYQSKLPEQGKWEAHRRYIDLQYVAEGCEQIGYAHLSRLALGDYNPEKDFQALTGQGDFITLNAGDFMLLFPQDAHMPGMALGESAPVKKIVVKIAVD